MTLECTKMIKVQVQFGRGGSNTKYTYYAPAYVKVSDKVHIALAGSNYLATITDIGSSYNSDNMKRVSGVVMKVPDAP